MSTHGWKGEQKLRYRYNWQQECWDYQAWFGVLHVRPNDVT